MYFLFHKFSTIFFTISPWPFLWTRFFCFPVKNARIKMKNIMCAIKFCSHKSGFYSIIQDFPGKLLWNCFGKLWEYRIGFSFWTSAGFMVIFWLNLGCNVIFWGNFLWFQIFIEKLSKNLNFRSFCFKFSVFWWKFNFYWKFFLNFGASKKLFQINSFAAPFHHFKANSFPNPFYFNSV